MHELQRRCVWVLRLASLGQYGFSTESNDFFSTECNAAGGSDDECTILSMILRFSAKVHMEMTKVEHEPYNNSLKTRTLMAFELSGGSGTMQRVAFNVQPKNSERK